MPEIPDDAYAMLGHNGQVVLIVPSLDLVVVRMGCSSGYQCKEVLDFMSLVLEALSKG